MPSSPTRSAGTSDDRSSRQGAGKQARPHCLHRLFEARAARTPDAVAVSFEGAHLTYAELDAAAGRLAATLHALGVGPEVPVGLFLERSPRVIVAILAILKAGGAYVPLDPAYPADRLAMILDDARVPVLLTERGLLERVPPGAARVVCLDDPEGLDALPASPALATGVVPANLAYIIYTSGSTGRPKGVAVTHANASRLFSATRAWFSFGPDDVWSLFHSFAFDFSVWEIWGALLFGGRLVIVPYWVSRSPEAFLGLLRDEGVTVLNQTPSAFRQLIRADEAAGEPAELALRLVIFGGEALDLAPLRTWFGRRGDREPQLVNMYGITETTVHVTYRPVSADDPETNATSSPIGVPIPDLRLYLLDARLRPVPVGVVGEIFVGGAGLARGYLNRPGLTADRFLPDPFRSTPGARMYRSGDLARRRPDGDLEYLGRSDNQVKIRGFRIELGEIEAALGRIESVRDAVVIAREDRPGDPRLVAYLVPRRESLPPPSELRRSLEASLPGYMIPSAFVALPSLPLTPHGKLDREALPAPGGDRSPRSSPFEPARTPTERAVAGVWSDVLAVGRVGVLDNFFDLGGHSLLATQVMSRLREAFGIEIPLRVLFDAPTVEGLARRVEAADRDRIAPASAIRSGNSGDVLSFAQQALWYLDRVAPGRPTFNVTAAVRISGPLHVEAFRRALDEVVRRHEVLRTTFPTVDGRPVSVVSPASTTSLGSVDLSGLPEGRRTAEVEALSAAEARRPFDLATGPLFRATLLRLADDEHAVLLAMHHIVTDGWSFGVAAMELSRLYESFREGAPSPLADLPIQFSDYALWQRERLRGEVLDGLIGYWRAKLEGVPPLDLPSDRPRPGVRGDRGATLFFDLSPELSEALRTLCRREGVTPYMMLLAAFEVVLHASSGQPDFAVGSPVANRNSTEVEGLIGYFVNMLAMRADLSGDPTFRELLGRVRETALGAFEHQELPLDVLVEALQPRRDPSRTPLFQVMFVLQNTIMPDALPRDLKLGDVGSPEGTDTAKFDLTLGMVEGDGGFSGSIEYSTDLFDEATIGRMIGQFRTLLADAAARPYARLSELSILPDDERERVLTTWNATESPFPRDRCVHELIAEQATRAPDAPAVVRGDEVLSYRELDAWAGRLARILRGLGVGAETRVGLVLDRSPELAVSILATLKAGAAYVPLDPAYPADRLRFLMDDSGIAVVLTRKHLEDALPETHAPVICVDHDFAFDREARSDASRAASPESPAYVIYTSGSTGVPKGVVVPHRALVNHNVAASRLFGLSPADRVLQFGSISFDLAAEEIFPAWISGAAVILRDDEYLDPARFGRRVARDRITVLDLPTAFWHAWVRELAATGEPLPETLRLVVIGGEEASAAAAATWRAIAGDRVRLLNTYGPTEATIIATSHEPGEADSPRVAIGRPIANARAYVLDAHLRPLPIGRAGELFLGGEGLARGYLNRPGLTAERFLPDPFGAEPGGRLYRTGDLARRRADGALEFLGRVDDQVKIRGFRVELGEVEAALLECPGVDGAAVVVREDDRGEPSLAAYIAGRPGGKPSPERARQILKARLPRHLVPATIVALDALPLTVTGKVDRKALKASPHDHVTPRSGRPPGDEVERRLAAIFGEVLAVPAVGASDDFFDLGGHSLVAVRLVARIEQEFGREVSLADLLRGPTVEDLADLLRVRGPDRGLARSGSPLVALQPHGDGPPFFCVHPAGGVASGFIELARALGPERPFYGLQSIGLGDEAPQESIEAMAATYIDAIRLVRPRGPYLLGGWSLGGMVAFEMARQLIGRGETVPTVAIVDVPAPAREEFRVTATAERLAGALAGLDLFGDPGHDPREDAVVLGVFAEEFGASTRGNMRALIARLRELDPADRARAILRHFRLDGLYGLDADPGRLARLLRVLRANTLAGARYRPSGPYAGRLAVFRAGDRGRILADPTLGWARLANGGVETFSIPGDHTSILAQPGVRALADGLRRVLVAAEGATA